MPRSNLEAEWPGTSSTCLQFPVQPKHGLLFSQHHTATAFCPPVMPCAFSPHVFAHGPIFLSKACCCWSAQLKLTSSLHPVWNCLSYIDYPVWNSYDIHSTYVTCNYVSVVALLFLSRGRAAALWWKLTYQWISSISNETLGMLQISVQSMWHHW